MSPKNKDKFLQEIKLLDGLEIKENMNEIKQYFSNKYKLFFNVNIIGNKKYQLKVSSFFKPGNQPKINNN